MVDNTIISSHQPACIRVRQRLAEFHWLTGSRAAGLLPGHWLAVDLLDFENGGLWAVGERDITK